MDKLSKVVASMGVIAVMTLGSNLANSILEEHEMAARARSVVRAAKFCEHMNQRYGNGRYPVTGAEIIALLEDRYPEYRAEQEKKKEN